MKTTSGYRRTLLRSAVGAAVARYLPGSALAATVPGMRLEWQQFKASSQYQSFLSAITRMRNNTNAQDRNSLNFWATVHVNQCPHGAPYFLAWHRGYLYHFERQLRIASGDASLCLPYWDYYSYATLPAEFTDPASNNPLYRQRLGANVGAALDLAPFAPSVFNFERGTANAFEPRIEDIHNPIHDLIGGVMSTMQSPLDPIFYLHHASIDRLTHAWALPDGKGIPFSSNPYSSASSSPYWAGSHAYATGLTIERYKTLDPSWLGTSYASTSVPTSLPPATSRPPALALERPPYQVFRPTLGRRLSATRRSVGGVLHPLFDKRSLSIRIRLNPRDAVEVARIVAARCAPDASLAPTRADAIKIVVDQAAVTDGAGQGGFFYAFYLNMPAVIDSLDERETSFFATLGAFQVAAASHHGAARVEFDVTQLLAQQTRSDFSEFSLSWLRVDGDNPPAGKTIEVGELRIDLTVDAPPVPAPRMAGPAGWYGQ